MRRVDVEGEITDVGEVRHVNLKTGGEGRTGDAGFKDSSGSIVLSLWDDEIDRVMVGSRVKITNGYTNTYRGQLKLSVGRYGKMEVLEGASKQQQPSGESTPPAKEQARFPTKGAKLDHYYGNVKDLQETDLVGAKQLLGQGWTLEGIKEKHVSVETPSGLTHESSVVYVLSRRE